MNKNRALLITTGLLTSLAAAQVQAAGFQLSERSVNGLGRAFAGGSLVGDDASAVFFNPADMVLVDDRRAQVNLFYIDITADFEGSSTKVPVNVPTGTPIAAPSVSRGSADGGVGALVPNTYYVQRLNDKLVLGVGVHAPFGLETSYDNNWVGRYHALDSEVLTIDFNPALAYQVNPQLSVGLGLDVQYVEGRLTRAVFQGPGVPDGHVEVTGDDISFGFNLGLTYQLDADTRFGISYRSAVEQNLEGERDLSGLVGPAEALVSKIDAKLDVDLPESIHIHAFKRLNPQWAVMAGARWTRWSRFEELRIEFADDTVDVTPEEWENQWMLMLGVEYSPNRDWTVRAGYAFDQGAVPSTELRTPRIPDADRQWLTLGASYRPRSNITVDIGYAHLFVDEVDMDNTLPIADLGGGNVLLDNLAGEYTGDVDILGAQVTIAF